ncbi:DHA2 family efflux MFS transporter permease subunit [Paenibacillus enshidis]|uniref:DHA2 family efflux MFS transporter permease subunit n=1 Tax=Paenibacillus enshidis TaxID=1458439 RepID=A0ABV5AX27_9BACL
MHVTTVEIKQNAVQNYKVIPIMISLLLSGFIGMFSETALNVALSDLMSLFHISASTAQWLTTGYLLTLSVLVPVSGLLLQWFTTRQLFIAALSFSILGTLVSALAPGFEVLLIGRIIQAASMALLLPLIFNTILHIFPAEKRGTIIGILGLVLVVAPAVGPSVSGFLIDTLGWQWIFWLSIPFLAIALLFGSLNLQNVSTITKPKIDILSLIVSTFGFGGIVFAFSKVGEGDGGWGSTEVIISMSIGILALIIFIIRQLTMSQPMLNLRAFKHPMFTIGTLMLVVCMIILLTTIIALPMYLIQGLGFSTLKAGLVLLPGGILQAVMSPVMGKLFDKFGPKLIVPMGLVLTSTSLWFFTGLNTSSSVALIVLFHSLIMISNCMVWTSQANGLNQLPPELYPDGSAIMNTFQQLAGAVGTAVAVSIMTAGVNRFMNDVSDKTDPVNGPLSIIAGIQHSFVFPLIVAILGLIFALFIKRVHVTKGLEK